MEKIDLAPYFQLKDKDLRKDGLFIGEGKEVVDRMIESGCRLHSILCIPVLYEYYTNLVNEKCPVYVLEKKEIGEIAGISFHKGVLAAGIRPQFLKIEENLKDLSSVSTIIICPNIDHADNLGSIFRSARAFGIKNIILGKLCADPFTRKTIRVSMGNIFFLNLYFMDDEDLTSKILKENNFLIIGTSLSDKSISIKNCKNAKKKAIVFGHEFTGIPEQWISLCDELVTIPMSDNTDSLNVSVAAGIFLYHFSQ